MKIQHFLLEKGQTSLEYALVIAVSAGLGLTFLKKFKGYMLDNPDSYVRLQLKLYERMFDPSLNYKRFRLPR
jgi:hypothetical protein